VNMLRLVLLLLLVPLVAGCASSQQTVTVVRTGDATFPPTRFVDMLDTAPSRPYVEIGVINAPGEAGALRTQVLAQVRDKAAELGADAVILQDLSRTTPASPRLNPTTGQYENTGGVLVPAFKGIAIKYR
jgi:hypothetical protein